ncbi:MAG: hypothetical protein V7785_21875 [Bermanella sp.]
MPDKKGIQITLRLAPNMTKEQINTWLGEEGALLGLVHAPEHIQLKPPASQEPKGGNLCRLAGQWCKEKKFWDFLMEQGFLFAIEDNPDKNESNAVKAIYRECGIKSRIDLDQPENKTQAEAFKQKIIRPYAEYLKGEGKYPAVLPC